MYFGKYDKSLRDKRKLKVFVELDEESDYLDFMYFCKLEGPMYSKSFECLIINFIILYYLSNFSSLFTIFYIVMILQYISNKINDYDYLHDQSDEDPILDYLDFLGSDFFVDPYIFYFYNLMGMVFKSADDQQFIDYNNILFKLKSKNFNNYSIYTLKLIDINLLKKKI